MFAVLVESGRETDRVGKFDAHHASRTRNVFAAEHACAADRGQRIERGQAGGVCGLGIKCKQ